MIRFIICGSFAVLFLVGSLPILLIEFLIGIFFPDVRARSCQFIIKWVFKALLFLAGTHVEFIGEENVPKDRAVLYTPNHRSIFDVIITYTRCPRQTGYVAKKETSYIPIFSIWMAFMNCTFLDRNDLRKGLKVIKHCIDLVNSGKSITIFPEGTRNKGDDLLLPFHQGSFKIAEKTGCPIIPVAISNSQEIFEAHLPWVKSTHVYVEYCKPIEVSEMDRSHYKEIGSMVSSEIEEALNRHKLTP